MLIMNLAMFIKATLNNRKAFVGNFPVEINHNINVVLQFLRVVTYFSPQYLCTNRAKVLGAHANITLNSVTC